MKEQIKESLKTSSQVSYPIWEEINSQKEHIDYSIDIVVQTKKEILEFMDNYAKLYFIGCGSSFHAGLIAEFIYNKSFKDRSACGITGAEFFLYPDISIKNNSENDIFFLISRTGRTTELIYSANEVKKRQGRLFSIVTFPDSPLAQMSDYGIVLDKAQEKSVTATRTVTSTTAVLIMLIHLIKKEESIFEKLSEQNHMFFKNLKSYSESISSLIKKENLQNFIFLGSGSFYGVAKEAELKVKEMSISNTESNVPLEFRHGHKAIAGDSTLATVFITNSISDYEVNVIRDLQRQNVKVITVRDSSSNLKIDKKCDLDICLDIQLDKNFRPIFYQVFGQLIGFHNALKKGINPTNPENLDYYVTF